MNNDIKEIIDYVFSLAYGECFSDELEDIKKAEDYITNLQEIEKEHKNCTRKHWQQKCAEHCANEMIYKSRNEKAINEIIRVLQIILEQPSKDKLDDLWIINRLEGIQTLLQGDDNSE